MDISIKVTYKSEGLQKLRKAAGLFCAGEFRLVLCL